MNACQIPVGSRLLIDLPPIRHHGRYLGNGQVVHNSKKNGMVCIETFEAFSGGKSSSKQITAALGGISLGVLIATAKKLSVRQSLLLAGAMGLGSLMLVNSFER